MGTLPVGSLVKNLSALQETQAQSLSQEDPLEKGKAAHSSILELDATEQLPLSFHFHFSR